MPDAKTSMVSYAMMTDGEERKLASLEREVVGFVAKVLGSNQRPMWTGGTAGEGRMVRLVVPGQMPPVIIELPPQEIPKLTATSLISMLNAQISRQLK